jgi:hypothetical protein
MVPGTTTTKTYANRFSCPSTTPVALDTIVCTVATRSDQVVFGDDLERGEIHDDGERRSLRKTPICLSERPDVFCRTKTLTVAPVHY